MVKIFTVGPMEANCYIVYDPDKREGLIIDPGAEGSRLIKFIRQKNISINYIVNTHGHPDHVGANRKIKEYTNAPILIHPYDAPLLAKSNSILPLIFPMESSSPAADTFIKDGDVIECGEMKLKVLHTPGHTPGGISLLLDDSIFTGDTLFSGSIGRFDLPGGSEEVLLNSIKKILSLGENLIIYPGHGPSTTVSQELHSNPFIT
ncbi:MBL fold metallo-hydrolase [bacterium]|nr:MBL fold metallo-hydrolase [bacterium]NIN93052.1 MBL fold metallo-hydrolase [bacterium]NIO18921.1 MBL fold metallo-hydrolase [bacterium]NIO74002.1 MBL fold metallo-hydrolase [bacterium]